MSRSDHKKVSVSILQQMWLQWRNTPPLLARCECETGSDADVIGRIGTVVEEI